MRISAMKSPALLSAPIALLALAAAVNQSGFGRGEETQLSARPAQAGAEPIPLRPGGVRMGEGRTLSGLPGPLGSSSGGRDLMFRSEDRARFHAMHPFLLPGGPPGTRARDSLRARQKAGAFLLVRKSGQGR